MDISNKLFLFDKEVGENIVGIDEVGRGPLAGPVVSSAVKLIKYSNELDTINDSKKISEKKREKLYDIIKAHFIVGIGIASVEEIEEINILNATFLSMNRAIQDLQKEQQNEIDDDFILLVDGNLRIKNNSMIQKTVVKGDSTSLAIAAASIIAKVTRDRMMIELGVIYPEYGFEKHKGYGTKAHIEAIKNFGVLDIHRKSFLKNIVG